MQKDTLIIFVKNPELGKVKTRLAATLGEKKALKIYQQLLGHTCDISSKVTANKTVFYSSFIPEHDIWTDAGFEQAKQYGKDLGEKMLNAFENKFQNSHRKVVIIGSDCNELSTPIIEQAFSALDFVDIVIGPALDGGYYLLGMKELNKNLFQNIPWSTESVLEETVGRINTQKLSFLLLKTLSDIDTEEDLNRVK